MKILIMFSHPWRGGRSSGAEAHAIQLMRELMGRGHQIVFVASTGRANQGTGPDGALADYRLPFQTLNPFDKRKVHRQLVEIVTRHGIDLIHAHQRTAGYFAESAGRATGVPAVVTVHDIWHNALFKRAHGRIFRRLIAVSNYIKKGLENNFGIPGERIRIIHNGVDPARIEGATAEDAARFRQEFAIGENEVVFSLIGRVTVSKGHYDLIEALRLLPADLPACRFLIVGEGPARAALQKLVRRYGLESRVNFCGFQSNIPAVMRASDVIVLPSHREPFAITVVEAMFAARALLVSDSGGTPEAVTDGREGLVFPLRDAEALAHGIERLARDKALRLRLGEEGHSTAHRRFLLSTIIDQTEAYYTEIVAADRR